MTDADARCWWCGDTATTREHRFNRTELTRVAAIDSEGRPIARSVYHGGNGYDGTLNGIKKGSAVQWKMTLCADCNGSKSQPFDTAYESFSDWCHNHQDDILRMKSITWSHIYGDAWSSKALSLSRYMTKQAGCFLSHHDIDVPEAVRDFTANGIQSSSLSLGLFRERGRQDLHRLGQRDGIDVRGYWMLPPDATRDAATQELASFTYAYAIGFVTWYVAWDYRRDLGGRLHTQRKMRLPCLGDPVDLSRFKPQHGDNGETEMVQ